MLGTKNKKESWVKQQPYLQKNLQSKEESDEQIDNLKREVD